MDERDRLKCADQKLHPLYSWNDGRPNRLNRSAIQRRATICETESGAVLRDFSKGRHKHRRNVSTNSKLTVYNPNDRGIRTQINDETDIE